VQDAGQGQAAEARADDGDGDVGAGAGHGGLLRSRWGAPVVPSPPTVTNMFVKNKFATNMF
jgi:hypothetical protein